MGVFTDRKLYYIIVLSIFSQVLDFFYPVRIVTLSFLPWILFIGAVFTAFTYQSKQELPICCLEFFHGCRCQWVGSHSGSHCLLHIWPLWPRYSDSQTGWNWIWFINRSITFLPYFINVASVLNSILFRMHFLILFLIYLFLDAATLTEVFPCFFLSCKANARVQLAKTEHGPHSPKLLCCSMYCLFCIVLCIVCV